jgi:hypothetical protein
VTQSSASDRFRIVYNNPLLSAANNEWANFTMYPNPSKGGNFTIILPTEVKDGILNLYNILGEQVYTTVLENNKVHTINPAKSLATGIYFVEIQSQSNKSIKKLIIE